MMIRCTRIEEHGSMVVGHGVDSRDQPVSFVGDHRMMGVVAEAICARGHADCEVEAWQIKAAGTLREGRHGE